MAQGVASEGEKKERHRSPNYPAIGLREAVDRLGKFYKEDGRAGAMPEVAAKHIGYGSAHGQAMSSLAALKRFGLIADSGGRLIPTRSAIEILNLPQSDARRQSALREAALKPSLYGELVAEFQGKGLPAAESLEAELKAYRGFNPNAVAGFVRDFFDTLNFAGITVSDTVESFSSGSPPEETVLSSSNVIDSIGLNPPSPLAPVIYTPVADGAKSSAWTWTLSMPRNVKAELRIAGDATKGDIARLKKQIEFLEESFDEENAK